MENFFSDLKVVELAGVLAGPSAGLFFAELGAKVVKVENPRTHGDVTRTWKLRSEDPADPASAYFWSVNAFKQQIEIDLSLETGKEHLRSLVRDADVVITNYKPGDDAKLGVDYPTLAALNPRIIVAAINGFGPGSVRTAYDLILQAESGFMYLNGASESAPMKMPVALIDLIAGHQLKEAILIALLARERHGKGASISVSLFDSAVASLANQATNWLIAHQLPKPGGSLHPNIAPYGEVFETKDKQQVTFAIGSNRQFQSLCGVLGITDVRSDNRFATNQQRVINRTQLYHLIYDRVHTFNFSDLYSRCLRDQVPIGKIRNLKEVFALPEAQSLLRQFAIAGKDITTVSSIAFRFHP